MIFNNQGDSFALALLPSHNLVNFHGLSFNNLKKLFAFKHPPTFSNTLLYECFNLTPGTELTTLDTQEYELEEAKKSQEKKGE